MNKPARYPLHELNPLLCGHWTDTLRAVESFLTVTAAGAAQSDLTGQDHEGLDMALRVAAAALKIQRECGEYTPDHCTLEPETSPVRAVAGGSSNG